jgi:hypothetical protein
LSGNEQVFPDGVESTPIQASVFRELYNYGSTKSLKLNASIRVQLKKILGGLADELRDFRKAGTIDIVVELDNVQQFINPDEQNPTFSYDNSLPAVQNDIENGTTYAGAFGNNNQVFTLTNPVPYSIFPFGIGDTVTFTTVGARVITALVPNAGNVTAFTVNGANIATANDSITAATIGTFKQTKVENEVLADFTDLYPNGTAVAIYSDADVLISNTLTVTNAVQSNDDLLVTFSDVSGIQLPDIKILKTLPLALNYSANTNPLPADIPTVANYTSATLPLWVGQAVLVTAKANLTPTYSVITKISYAGGKALLTFSPQIPVTGNVNSPVLATITADTLSISYPERWELVQYRTRSKLYDNIGLSNKFKKWVYDADLIPELPVNGMYEKTFLLEPLTSCVVLCLCPTNSLVSNVGDLYSYRLRIDGVDTTTRDILLNADGSYKLERLTNGFQSLSENLTALATDPKLNLLSAGNKTYTILQDLLVDGQSHKLTVSIRNGSTSVYEQRNIRLFKSVITQF